MLTNANTQSVAGSWGAEKRKQLLLSSGNQDKEMYKSMSRQTFTYENVKQEKEKQQNKYSKFKTLQQSGSQIIQYTPDNEFTEMDPKLEIMAEDIPEFDHSMRRTSFSNKGALPDLSRTNSSLMRTADCPIAVGRSGLRHEKGVSTSGLLGERLMRSNDPRKDSFAQRSWLYNPDPALNYKVNGVPEAHMPNDVSLAIGGENTTDKFAGWTYGRKAILTGDVLTRSGNLRAGVYQDDYL